MLDDDNKEPFTKDTFLVALKSLYIGEWVFDKENDGTHEHPIQVPFVDYSEVVNNFIDDV